MPKVIFHNGRHNITVPSGMSLLRAIRSRDLAMPPECEGAACRRCQVYISSGAAELSPPTAAELRHLGFLLGQGYRLACQAQGVESGRPFAWLRRWVPAAPDAAPKVLDPPPARPAAAPPPPDEADNETAMEATG